MYLQLVGVVLVIFFAISAYSDDAVDVPSFKFIKLEMCNPSVDYPLKLTYEFKTKDGKQYLNGNSVFNVNFGEDSDYNVTIYLKKTRDDPEFTPIFTFYEEDACTAIQKYLGDMVEDMEKAAGMDPGKCPIPKGTYSLTDYPLDYNKIPYQSIPEGILQAKQVITNKKTQEIVLCTLSEAENLPAN